MPLTSVILAAGLVVTLGALVQGAVGYGMALVAAPLLALFDPMLVPVPLILLSSVHSVLAVVRDGRHADWSGIGWAILGRLPGTGLGVLAVVALSQQVFGLVVGLCVLACVALSLLSWRPRPRPRALLLAGIASGVGGTAAGIGGPPIALLYQNEAGPRDDRRLLRPGVGAVDRRTGRRDQVTTGSLASAALLTPFMLAGFALSGPARRVLDNGWTRRAVLTVAAASAVLLIGRAVLS